MSEPLRLIRKYPNRRLYDTRTSRYITLKDVKSLVRSGEAFTVVDASTGANLTRSILLQIVSDEETAGSPLLTTDLLTQMIRFYGHSLQPTLGNCLAACVAQRITVHDQAKNQAVNGESERAASDVAAEDTTKANASQ